jgi:hypothetical protein
VKLRTGLVLASILALGASAHFFVRSAEDRVTADMLARVDRFTNSLGLATGRGGCPTGAVPVHQYQPLPQFSIDDGTPAKSSAPQKSRR